MEAVCGEGDPECPAHALSAALHSLHLYCATISAALMCCCVPLHKRHRHQKQWRGQNIRGVASLALGIVWCCGAAAALLRPAATVRLVAALMAPLAWLAAAAFHLALAARRTTAPVLYLAIYWLLASISSAAMLYQHIATDPSRTHVQIYFQGISAVLALVLSAVDCVCFYDEVGFIKSKFLNFHRNKVSNLGRVINLQCESDRLATPQTVVGVHSKRLAPFWMAFPITYYYFIMGYFITTGYVQYLLQALVLKRYDNNQKTPIEAKNVAYKHNDVHFYSKISYFWLNSLLNKGYEEPLDDRDIGDLPEKERSKNDYNKLMRIYSKQTGNKTDAGNPSIWKCYMKKVWPNFYLAGLLKLCGDLIGVVPPLGLAVIIQYIVDSNNIVESNAHVTITEYFSNGYVMLLLVLLALISQALLSQNSTHLVTIEGMRLKAALQAMVYNKCMRLAPWSSTDSNVDEDSPLLNSPEDTAATRTGLLTNLVSQDTYNIMSCVWICHYIWAVPLKVTVILYLLYRKLGVSALIGTAIGVLIITPLQFYIGKRLSDNSKEVSKCTDHRISKMSEILQGINVIKLYVWEDLFKEKILQLREVELKLLNKDSTYWCFLTFTTQISTILITVITFITYYFLETSNGLTAVNVFAGLAFFNQLTVPLLILPVTVLMVVQAVVSTKRIRDFLELPEASNVTAEDNNTEQQRKDIFNDAFVDKTPEEEITIWDKEDEDKEIKDDEDSFPVDISNTVNNLEYLVRFRNAAFTWGMKTDILIEVDDLDIPAGKLIMVVGASGSGKSSLLSAILGEMYIERGDISFNGPRSTWYAGQPPWLLEGSVRDNIVMDNPWCQQRYARVLRATGLGPDLQLLPENDMTRLGSHGAPLSGGQRVRVCVSRALYSPARLLALDEPLAALDAALARHLVARALVPAARAGRTVLLATNRLELMHYADLILVMEDGRVAGFGRAGSDGGILSRWSQLAGEARAAAARVGAGPPGGTARERSRLVRALSRARFHKCASDDTMLGINEAAGAHLLAEIPTCVGGSWRRSMMGPSLSRQLSSPPASVNNNSKFRRDVRRAVSADESNTTLQREASLLRRWMRPRTHRTLTRWTPRSLRRLISSDSDNSNQKEDAAVNNVTNDDSVIESMFNSLTSTGIETNAAIAEQPVPTKEETGDTINEFAIWREYAAACGWWGAMYWAAAAAAQALAVVADCWLARPTAQATETNVEQTWWVVRAYGAWCCASAIVSLSAGAACAAGGARARRALHERALHAALHMPVAHSRIPSPAYTLHRFSADVTVVDKKLPIAISRWGQLILVCAAAIIVNAMVAPWSILALLPAMLCYLTLQAIYLCNARELHHAEGRSAAGVVSLCTETYAGGATVRAGRLQSKMRVDFFRRLDANHNALLLLNAANRWLGLSLDLVGAVSVCVSLAVALSNGDAATAGLAGTYSLLLPAYLAHLAKCRADLDQQLAALERLYLDTNVPQEDYREDCPIPSGWQRNGKIEFENVNVQNDLGPAPILNNINITVSPGEKVAICGRSGSGKSTLLLSCVGGTTITQGYIYLDGQELRQVPLRTLRHRIVVLPQEQAMFSGTLRENLDPLAVHTDEEIWHCLKAVGLYDFVTAQPAGLECSVERGGRGWSGGRAARACAARAALHARPAAALLLDEPAAALDAPAERSLLAAIAALAPHTTIVTVVHRVSSIRGYDRAVVLDEGRVVETGAVGALLSQPNSRLARMLAAAHRLH